MSDGPAHPSRITDLLLIVAVVALPFIAGRNPSGAQTVLVLTAYVALAAIAFRIVTYGGRRPPAAGPERRPTEWAAPDELSALRSGRVADRPRTGGRRLRSLGGRRASPRH